MGVPETGVEKGSEMEKLVESSRDQVEAAVRGPCYI